jgi:hypothetical protein
MHRYVRQANVDHYLRILRSTDLTPQDRSSITGLLMAEIDKLAHDLEHLEFAESRAASYRKEVNELAEMRNSFAFGTTDRERAEAKLVKTENILTLLEDLCHRLRKMIR